MNTDVLIVGGGLAGLSLADRLERSGMDYLLIEARPRLGGRIRSLAVQSGGEFDARFDLGPAWFWPGQPKMARLVNELDLGVFEQYAAGNLVFQDRDGAVQRDIQYSTMAGALRISGGIERLIEELYRRIPAHKVRLASTVTKLMLAADEIHSTVLVDRREVTIRSRKTVLALPPRLAASSIGFEPEPGPEALNAMRAIPTWMAGHAKVVAVYPRPFWRDAGLSGDGVSHRGPLVEIHDASPASNSQGALFGFVGVPPSVRQADGFDMAGRAVAQLIEMYGPGAASPLEIFMQDWAEEAFTATEEDVSAQAQTHHSYGVPRPLRNLWSGKLLLGASEMAPGFGGYLEGALEAAEIVAQRI